MTDHGLRQMLRRHVGLAGPDLGLAQPQPCRKYRKEAERPQRVRHYIGNGNQRQGQKVIGRSGAVGVLDSQVNHQMPDATAQSVPDQ
jgi:hypothetical protein